MWNQPKTNKIFQVSEEQAKQCAEFAYNQGFYNLFLSIAIVVGWCTQHAILIDYAMGSILAAAVVLVTRSPKKKRAAMIQGLPSVIYFLVRMFG